MAGAEDLVPAWISASLGGALVPDEFDDNGEHVRRYRPRIEGRFARIERRTRTDGTAYFRTVTPTNVTHIFGDTPDTCIADPADPRRVFSWLLSRSYDDRGNVVVYEYAAENLVGVPTSEAHESSRHAGNTLFSNKHLKRVRYGNATAYDPSSGVLPSFFFFDVVLDYGNHDADTPLVAPAPGAHWTSRQDPFSTGRAGFEMRTYRLCRRVLVFHTFSELGQTPVLVRSLETPPQRSDLNR